MDLPGRICLGTTLVLIALFSFFVNILVFVVWARTPKIRQPHFYVLVNLAVVDILAVCMWTSLSVSAIVGDDWILPDVMCSVHSYFISFCNIMSLHTLTFLALERLLKFFKPSSHEDICVRLFMVLFIAGLWFFDGVVCVFSSVQWATTRFYPAQFQCIPEYQLSVSHMNFMFVMTFGLLILVMLLCYPACFVKVYNMRRRIQPSGALVLETNMSAKGDSYSERMKRYSEMFQNAGMKSQKPKLEQTYNYTKDGYIPSSESTEGPVDEKSRYKKKTYSLAKEDYSLLKVYVLLSLVYLALWMPYVIVSYVWTYSRFTPLPDGVITALVCLTHCGLFIKPLVYGLCFKTFREAIKTVMKTVKRRK